jgi:hypothetical protein
MKFHLQGVTIFSAPFSRRLVFFYLPNSLATPSLCPSTTLSYNLTLIINMDTGSYDLDHFFNLDTDQGRPKRGTGQGRPALAGNEIWVILRALRPVPSDPKSLYFYSPDYNPVISDEELSDLRIQFHHLDIETGDVSSSSIPCFLPKADFPEFLEANDFYPDVFGGAEEMLSYLKRDNNHSAGSLAIFPHCLSLDFTAFSFEGSEDLQDKFRDFEDGLLNNYGWISDK